MILREIGSAFLLGLPHGEDWEHGQKHHQLVIGRDVYAQAKDNTLMGEVFVMFQ